MRSSVTSIPVLVLVAIATITVVAAFPLRNKLREQEDILAGEDFLSILMDNSFHSTTTTTTTTTMEPTTTILENLINNNINNVRSSRSTQNFAASSTELFRVGHFDVKIEETTSKEDITTIKIDIDQENEENKDLEFGSSRFNPYSQTLIYHDNVADGTNHARSISYSSIVQEIPKETNAYNLTTERNWETQEKPYVPSTSLPKIYGEPEQNYEVDEAVSVVTNGRTHGVQLPTKPVVVNKKLTNEDSNQKFGYVVEGRNYRKYRVEERTADGFIVGEYGVVSHNDGSLRGVRYTADGTINPRLISEALMKFLSL